MEEENQLIAQRKLFIISLIVLFVVLIIFVSFLWSRMGGEDYGVNIANQQNLQSQLSAHDLENLKKNFRDTIAPYYQIPDTTDINLTIRQATYASSDVSNNQQISFLMDSDTIQSTYEVWLLVNGDNFTDVSFNCVKRTDSRYPNSFCIGTDGISTIDLELSQYLPYNGTTDHGYNYEIYHNSYDPTLHVYVNSCGNQDIISEVRSSISEWLTSLNLNPEVFPLDIPADNCYDSMAD